MKELVAVVLAGLAVSTGAASATAPPSHAPRPSSDVAGMPGPFVQLVARSPLTVSGWRFIPGERVVVTLTRSPASIRLTTVVDRRGRFFARFAGIHVAACSQPRITVRSHRGIAVPRGLPACRAAD